MAYLLPIADTELHTAEVELLHRDVPDEPWSSVDGSHGAAVCVGVQRVRACMHGEIVRCGACVWCQFVAVKAT